MIDEEVNLFIDIIEEEYCKLKEMVDVSMESNECVKVKFFFVFWDFIFFIFFIVIGLRIFEVFNVRTEDINWNECIIKIFGKGLKEWLIFFGID